MYKILTENLFVDFLLKICYNYYIKEMEVQLAMNIYDIVCAIGVLIVTLVLIWRVGEEETQ